MDTPNPLAARRFPTLLQTLGVAAVVFTLLFARAMTREPNPDEHQFVSPAQLFNQHHLVPYIDYPLFHMPGLVFIYALIIKPFADPLLVTRAFSALMGATNALLIFLTAFTWFRESPSRYRWHFSLGLVVLFMGARVFTYTNGRAWNHDASMCALLGAVLLQFHAVRAHRVGLFLLIGLLLGLSFSIRLTTAPAVIALALCGLFLPSTLSIPKRLLACVLAFAGCLVALVPSLLLLRANPDEFVFGNLTYPALYKSYVLWHDPRHTTMPGKIVQFFETWLGDPGNALTLVLLGFALWRIARSRAWKGEHSGRVVTLLAVCVALWFGLTAPFQIQIQYHSVLLPFFLLLIAAAAASDQALSRDSRHWLRSMQVAALAVLLINFPRWYWKVIQLPFPSKWTPMQTLASAEWLKASVPPNALVLTVDPIVPLEVGLRVYPQFATGRFIFHVGPFMTNEDRVRHHMPWGPQLASLVAAEPPDAVFYSIDREPEVVAFKDIAEARGFTRLQSPDGIYALWVPAAK